MLNVQSYLNARVNLHGDSIDAALQQLTKDFGISAKIYPEDNMVLLDYNQIESPKSHPIVIECRSLILRLNDFSVLSQKFNRFFNAGECPEFYEDFVLSRAQVLEKADGSLIGVYFNDFTNKWEISTRGMAKAEGEHVFGGTFRQKVLEAMGVTEEQFQEKFDSFRGMTFVMELTGPCNRIVTKYEFPQMVLLSVNKDGLESHLPALNGWLVILQNLGINVRSLKTYDLKDTIDELIQSANELTDLQEGFVVWDEVSGKRMKIKSSTYLVAHRLRGNDTIPTRKNLMILVLEGEVEEFCCYFNEWRPAITEIQLEVKEFENKLSEIYNKYNDIVDQKDFALKVKDTHGSGYLFTARKTNTNPVKVFHSSNINQKLKTFGI